MAQGVTSEAPPAPAIHSATHSDREDGSRQAPQQALPNAPGTTLGLENDALELIPHALPLRDPAASRPVAQSDTESLHGDEIFLDGNVEITYQGRLLRADHIRFNRQTNEALAEGHVHLEGGDNDESMDADRGEYNLRSATGRFFNVRGSVGMHPNPQAGLQSVNPMLFTGRMVVKTGPRDYAIYDGSITSCLLPNPDWLFTARQISLTRGRVRAANSTFHLLGFPLLFFPVVTHPADQTTRQSGLLIPQLGFSSSTRGGSKGLTLGEGVYLAVGRSLDLTAGFDYFSQRGYREYGTIRLRGKGDDMLNGHFSALQDRGYIDTVTGLYVNQGGEDVTADFRHQFNASTRAAGDAEYLSSYVYREAFTENFNQAVSSDITSIGFITHAANGFVEAGRADRYQGLKRVSIDNLPEQQVHILHVPSLDVDAIDHRLPHTPLLWDVSSSFAGLKRVQPNFVSGGIIQRFDVRPEVSLPVRWDGWSALASVAVRETVYSRQRRAPYGANAAPIEVLEPLSRSSVEMQVDLRPPTLERTFALPPSLAKLFGAEARHTIEPELVWRRTAGIDNFLNVLRFDDQDLDSNTHELEYGVTQNLYFTPNAAKAPRLPANCPAPPQPPAGIAGARPAAATQPEAAGVVAEADPDSDAADGQDAEDATPSPGRLDANGIPAVSTTAPDAPTHTHAHGARRCEPLKETPPQRALISWRLTQKHFFDTTFGNAVIQNRRNIFDTTLNLSGVAFLTEARQISPLISRLRARTSGHTDVEWDFDLDTGAKKFTSSNLFLDAHTGALFGGLSYARLNAPGRFATEDIDTGTLNTSAVSNFSQMRVLLGYGQPTRPGLSLAGNVGLNLQNNTSTATGTTGTGTTTTVTQSSGNFAIQYAAVQTSYNWNCCGLTVEYRKFSLGSVRDENSYRFNFTLANIGTAGNLRRTEKLF